MTEGVQNSKQLPERESEKGRARERAQAVAARARNGRGRAPFMLAVRGYVQQWSAFRGGAERRKVLYLDKHAALLCFFGNGYCQMTEKCHY